MSTGDTPDTFSRPGKRYDPVFDVDVVFRALAEDVGRGDVTTEATIPTGSIASARIVTREDGVIAGLPIAGVAFRLLDPTITLDRALADGTPVAAGDTLIHVAGAARAILTAERTALNFVGRLSGIATLTAHCVEAVSGTGATIVDTRKTTPGLRNLEKYAVRMGGGSNHRAGLDDGLLIKDNHIAVAGGVRAAIERARERAPHLLRIEVECDSDEQVREAVACGVESILLDNMSLERLRENVAWIRAHAPATVVEASGSIGTDPERLLAVASAGVNLISLGALTHSAPHLDISLEFD